MKAITFQDYQARMLRVLVHIQENLDRDPGLEELARVAHFSPYHFHRVFRGMVGESVKAHLRRIRLERAALRLKHGAGSITDVALEAGYETHEAFTRAFRALMGQSPSEYRARQRAELQAAAPSGVHYAPDCRVLAFQPLTTGGEPMDVNIETMPPRRVAFVRHIGPYAQCGPAWRTLCGRLGPLGRLGPQTEFWGLCHDDPEVTSPEHLRYDACVPVDEGFQADGEVGVQVVEGGEYAVTMHRGAHENLGQTYARLCGEWIPRSGRAVRAAPSIEVYLNDPQQTPPDQLLTRIHMPLEPME